MKDAETEKREYRKKFTSIRAAVEGKAEKSAAIAERITDGDFYKSARTVAAYKSFSSEADTSLLIERAIKDGKTVALPKVTEKGLAFYAITPETKFVKSAFGTEEPVENAATEIKKEEIDVAIIPGLCFDKDGNRLGFGKGYYDGFLCGAKFLKVAACFEKQLTDKVPTTDRDEKVDVIVTEKNSYII